MSIWFSTTQPPLWITHVSPLSTTQPPSNTQSALVAMRSQRGLGGLGGRGAAFMRLRKELPQPVVPKGSAGKPASAQYSPGVLAQLAATELLTALQVRSDGAWSAAHGIPASCLAMAWHDDEGERHTRVTELGPVSATDYADSVVRVRNKMLSCKDRLQDILIQADDPALTMALGLGLDFEPESYRTPCTALCVDIVVATVTGPMHRLKDRLRVPRPKSDVWHLDPPVKPLIDTPLYTAYPSGHATVCGALAEVLAHIANVSPDGLRRLAAEIATNRECAGLHTDIDTRDGLVVGRELGASLVEASIGSAQAFPVWTEIVQSARGEW